MHPYFEHLTFILLVPALCAAVLFSAGLVRGHIPQLSLGYASVLVWAWIIVASYLTHSLGIQLTFIWAIACLAPVWVAIGISVKNRQSLGQVLRATPLADYVTLYLVWIVGFLVLAIPLLLYLPEGTIIAGRHICNDSAGHAFYAKGQEYFLSAVGYKPNFYWYPRGFHTTLFYFSQMLDVTPIKLLLPFLLFSYSFVVPFAWDIARSMRITGKVAMVGLGIAICSPFLNFAMLYQEFAAQGCVIPLMLTFLFRLFVPLECDRKIAIIAQLFLGCAAISSYSVLPFLLTGVGVGVYLLLEWRSISTLWNQFRSLLQIRMVIAVLAVIVVTAPGLFAMSFLVGHQLLGTGDATDILHSPGNLSGYLSPFHFSGFWNPSVEFRGSADPKDKWFEYAQILGIFLGFFLIVTSRFFHQLRGFLLTLALPVVGLPLLGATQYIHFKFLTVLIPAIPLCAALSLAYHAENGRRFSRAVLMMYVIGLVILGPIYSGQIFAKWPTFSDSEYREYRTLHDRYFRSGTVLFLTQDDWARYFTDRKDIFLPMLGLFPTPYNGELIRTLILDRSSKEANEAYLTSYTKISTLPRCLLGNAGRFAVYKFDCPD